jgi:hypothetical protein
MMPFSRQIRVEHHLPALAEPVGELLAVVREDGLLTEDALPQVRSVRML